MPLLLGGMWLTTSMKWAMLSVQCKLRIKPSLLINETSSCMVVRDPNASATCNVSPREITFAPSSSNVLNAAMSSGKSRSGILIVLTYILPARSKTQAAAMSTDSAASTITCEPSARGCPTQSAITAWFSRWTHRLHAPPPNGTKRFLPPLSFFGVIETPAPLTVNELNCHFFPPPMVGSLPSDRMSAVADVSHNTLSRWNFGA
mmetsp:Transcript_63726/g.142137  ORF Transcript_63726/g.142137 Transcript_63726/m.142137 type:complete len:204 (-) Transcript_63726:465-1076(-)